MTTSLNRGSAKIYQFPVRVRPALGGRREEAKSDDKLADQNFRSPGVSEAACGSAWYHEEAVREAELAGKN